MTVRAAAAEVNAMGWCVSASRQEEGLGFLDGLALVKRAVTAHLALGVTLEAVGV